LKRALHLKRKLDVGWCRHCSGDWDAKDGKPRSLRQNASRVDKNGILETEMGYECHPETDQSTIARERSAKQENRYPGEGATAPKG
jgi:hypothetical protein